MYASRRERCCERGAADDDGMMAVLVLVLIFERACCLRHETARDEIGVENWKDLKPLASLQLRITVRHAEESVFDAVLRHAHCCLPAHDRRPQRKHPPPSPATASLLVQKKA